MAQFLKPPSFVSETKSYAEYKDDLKRWSRITSVDKKLQADFIISTLDGHLSRIKEKIVTKIGESLVGDENGMTKLITFLDTIYEKDNMADVWDKFRTFSTHRRKPEEDIVDFLPNWEMAYQKFKGTGCEYPDTILGLKLLEDAQLNDMDTKLVLTGVNYDEATKDKNLQQQITNSLKKFTGRSVITSNRSDLAVSVKEEPTFLVRQMEDVFIANGWKPPQRGSRRRSRSVSPTRTNAYKGKKNRLGDDNKPLKCFICKCNHVERCNCPCVYHLADTCPDRRRYGKHCNDDNKENKPDLGLFMSTNYQCLATDGGDDAVF